MVNLLFFFAASLALGIEVVLFQLSPSDTL